GRSTHSTCPSQEVILLSSGVAELMVTGIKKARLTPNCNLPTSQEKSPPFRHVRSFPRRNDRPTRPTLPFHLRSFVSLLQAYHMPTRSYFSCATREPHSLSLLPLLDRALQPPTCMLFTL